MKKFKLIPKITSRGTDNYFRYINETKKFQILSPEHEVVLARLMAKGDASARNLFISSNTRFVISVAKSFVCNDVTLEDLISEGNIGLIVAVERFDDSKGFKFISLAVWYIRQNIYKYLAEHRSLIKVPTNQIVKISRINRTTQVLEQELSRSPTNEEVADRCNLELYQVDDCSTHPGPVYSLDSYVENSESLKLIDVIPDSNSPLPDEKYTDVQEQLLFKANLFIATLKKDRDRNIIRHYFGVSNYEKLTLDQIAIKFGISKETVRNLKRKAITYMQSIARKRGLSMY
ncbi:sigma-70 family RNA polymerase sigma factor [Pedobacter sp. PWIIR3]